MPTIQADALSTDPFVHDMAAASIDVLSVDMVNSLEAGETFTTATSTLRNVATGALVADVPAPTVSTTKILQLVDGPDLGFVKGDTYELVLIAHVSATSQPVRRAYLRVLA